MRKAEATSSRDAGQSVERGQRAAKSEVCVAAAKASAATPKPEVAAIRALMRLNQGAKNEWLNAFPSGNFTLMRQCSLVTASIAFQNFLVCENGECPVSAT
jgi:hypothetical protein